MNGNVLNGVIVRMLWMKFWIQKMNI